MANAIGRALTAAESLLFAEGWAAGKRDRAERLAERETDALLAAAEVRDAVKDKESLLYDELEPDRLTAIYTALLNAGGELTEAHPTECDLPDLVGTANDYQRAWLTPHRSDAEKE